MKQGEPLTPHPSPLTPHPSPLTPHPSPLTPHREGPQEEDGLCRQVLMAG